MSLQHSPSMAPRRASSSATAAPRPAFAPVITTTFPCTDSSFPNSSGCLSFRAARSSLHTLSNDLGFDASWGGADPPAPELLLIVASSLNGQPGFYMPHRDCMDCRWTAGGVTRTQKDNGSHALVRQGCGDVRLLQHHAYKTSNTLTKHVNKNKTYRTQLVNTNSFSECSCCLHQII